MIIKTIKFTLEQRMFWRVNAISVKNNPLIDKIGPIKFQGFDCGSSISRQTDNYSKVFVPFKMGSPFIFSRMKKPYLFFRKWVYS